jgi:hypothetical protein
VLRFLCALAIGATAATVQGATVIAFDRALPGQPFTLSNPQTFPVTGTLRVHPRLTGPSSTKVISFTLAAGEYKTFANLLQDLVETKASVIRIESSDLLGDTLRPVTPGNSDASSLVYTPGGTDPTILIAALNSTLRVKIFASNTTMIAVFSQEFTVNGEATLALQASAILGDTRIPGGFVVVEPVTGAASVTTTYVPSRRRSVGHRGLAPVYFSVSTPGCAGTTGATASVTLPPVGMTYGWEVLNGTPEGSSSNTLFAFTLGQKGYSTVRLTSRLDDISSTSMAAVVRVDAAPTVSSLTPRDVQTNETETISWQVSSDATTGKLYGSDFPSQGLTVNLAAGSYSYTADSAGSKWVELVVGNGCGTNSKRSTYDVIAPAPSGSITAPSICSFSINLTPCEITVVVENVPAGVEWKLRSAIGNGFDDHGTGSGTFNRRYVVGSEPGQDTITVEVDGVVFASAPILVVAADITANPSPIQFGQTSSLTIIVEYLPAGKEWKLRSAKGNLFGGGGAAGMGSGTFTRTYMAENANGVDTITLEVDDVVIVSIPIQVN